MVLGEKTVKENDDRLHGEWAERTDQASRTQMAPSAVSSVTHSTALTCACKGARCEHIRLPSGALMTG